MMSNQPLTQIIHGIKISDQKYSSIDLDGVQNENISEFPVQIDNQYMEDSERLAQILNSVLVMFAYNYVRDGRLQEIYYIDKDLHEIVLMAEGTPYEIGLYAPQFWYDENGQAKIGHFNSRQALKNYLLSCRLSNAVAESSKDKKCLSDFLERYDSDDTLYVIRDHDDSDSIEELEQYGIKIKEVKHTDFVIKDGKLMVGEELARQFYLDVDREELKAFDKEVLRAIITSGRCINDVRTLILIQDVRTLAILKNDQIMGSYINQDDHKFLNSMLTPLFLIQTKEDQELLLNSEDNWVLIKNNPGNSNNVLKKNSTPKEEWEDVVKNKWYQYTVSQNIEKQNFQLDTKNAEIIGSDIFFNGKSYGPGLFTALSEDGSTKRMIPQLKSE